jgi:hypothetical protein
MIPAMGHYFSINGFDRCQSFDLWRHVSALSYKSLFEFLTMKS